ncbi:MAG: energy-coupling factor transporter transmembrane protein EcfT [Clostridiales bacterium]|jgi:energy-coupling factor transport system permease protein|nr:energy-coupling factor transporter transmembrane protein EcfT [Clostridiales bacterium]
MKKPDPRVIFALVFATSTFAILIRENLAQMAGLFALVLACAALLRVPLKQLFGRLKRLLQILLFVAILRSFFTPSGLVLLAAWGLPLLTTGGLSMGILVALRLLVFIVGASIFTIYPTRALIQAMVQLRLPYEIAYMVSIGIRFVPQMAQELRDSLIALQLRGIVIEELKLKKRISLYSYLLLPTIVGGLRHAKELAMSMEMRAFRAKPSRTSFFSLKLSSKDVILLILIAVAAIAGGFIL